MMNKTSGGRISKVIQARRIRDRATHFHFALEIAKRLSPTLPRNSYAPLKLEKRLACILNGLHGAFEIERFAERHLQQHDEQAKRKRRCVIRCTSTLNSFWMLTPRLADVNTSGAFIAAAYFRAVFTVSACAATSGE